MGISSIQCSKHSKLLAFLEISLVQGFVFLKTLVCITECVWHSFTGITWFSMQRASNVLRNIFITNVLKHIYTSFAEMVNLPLNNITILCWSLLINNQCWSWISPCGSYDYEMPFSNNHQESEKSKGLLLIWPGNYMACLEAHSEVTGREIAHSPGVLLLLGLRVEA